MKGPSSTCSAGGRSSSATRAMSGNVSREKFSFFHRSSTVRPSSSKYASIFTHPPCCFQSQGPFAVPTVMSEPLTDCPSFLLAEPRACAFGGRWLRWFAPLLSL